MQQAIGEQRQIHYFLAQSDFYAPASYPVFMVLMAGERGGWERMREKRVAGYSPRSKAGLLAER